jgi:16S rRNA (adenine1518-N6/adenine1519-N6)-dimethyltransferase
MVESKSPKPTSPQPRKTGRAGHRPPVRKRFGQHFLEPAWVRKLLAALAPEPADTFLEIGPGRGALTSPLAAMVARVIAVEIDRDLAAAMAATAPPNVETVEGDVLRIDLARLIRDAGPPVRVVGNLPYNISSSILFRLLDHSESGRSIRDATVMLQKEVADRLVAQPGTSAYGVLAIQVAIAADVERLLVLPPGAFRPPPAVTSAVVRLRFRPARVDVGKPATFERIVRGIFLQRRKTLLNALTPVAGALGQDAAALIRRAAVDGTARPQALTVADLARLSRAVL